MLDGIKGFFTSKRGIGFIVGAVVMALGAIAPVEIDPELRKEFIEGIFWLTSLFIGGTSLSDTWGKGNTEMKAKMASFISTTLEVVADVAGDLNKGEAPVDGGDSA